jgi:predicted Zn-dependent protease
MDRRSSWLLLLALCVILQACAKKTVTHAPATMRVLTNGIVRGGSIEDPVEPRAHHVQSDAALLEPVVRVSSRLIAAARRSEFGSQALALCWSIAVYEDHAPSRTFVTPDGVVVVSSGSFPLAQTEAGLAALLSHELVHALVHGAASISPPCSGHTTEPPPALFTYEEELRADELGLTLMADAGYDPSELLHLWERMKQQTDGDAALVHLTYDRRMDRMTQWWKDALTRYERANRAPQKALPLK